MDIDPSRGNTKGNILYSPKPMNCITLDDEQSWGEFCTQAHLNYEYSLSAGDAPNFFQGNVICILDVPPSNIYNMCLDTLSYLIKFSDRLKTIRLRLKKRNEPGSEHVLFDGRSPLGDLSVTSAVCSAILASSAPQKIEFQVWLNNCGMILPIANLIKNCTRTLDLHLRERDNLGVRLDNLRIDALRHMSPSLRALNLSRCRIGGEDICALTENLKVNTTLEVLSFEGAQNIGDEGAKAVALALQHNGTLKRLSLWRSEIGREGGVAMGVALQQNRTLERLDMGGNHIGDEAAIELANAIKGGSSLRELALWACGIGENGGVALAEALVQNTTLELLSMNLNPVGDVGAVAVSRLLTHNKTLKTLGIAQALVGKEGVIAVANAMRVNTTLVNLCLSSNAVGDDGAAVLADALKKNASLEHLQIASCGIGKAGAVELARVVACNSSLTLLNFYGNASITNDGGLQALAECLNVNSTLTTLNLTAEADRHRGDIDFALCRNKALAREAKWMAQFSNQDVCLKGKVLANAMERFSRSNFTELTFLFLRSQAATLSETETVSCM